MPDKSSCCLPQMTTSASMKEYRASRCHRKILRLAPWSGKDPLAKSTEVGLLPLRRMLLLKGTTIFQ